MNIYLISGDDYLDDYRLVLAVADGDGDPIDLTDVALTFQVRRSRSAEPIIEKTDLDDIEIAAQADDTIGVAYLALASADTADLSGRYLWELEGVDAIGHVTLGDGVLYVRPDLIP